MDFRSPSVKQIADFLLYLFQVKLLQPSTIDGYRTAIADKVGNSRINISKDENVNRLLDSFYRDKPKGKRGVHSWNLSLVLHQLTKAPFEPFQKASLKHLTFKTVFLLALGSGKRKSEIHAWLHKNIRHQENWLNVSLYPSPSFLSKNHLAKDGPRCVAPVIIPALVSTTVTFWYKEQYLNLLRLEYSISLLDFGPPGQYPNLLNWTFYPQKPQFDFLPS